MITRAWFKQNYLVLVFSACFILVLGWFFWDQWGPVQIRKRCAHEAYSKGWTIRSDSNFEICVLKSGIKP